MSDRDVYHSHSDPTREGREAMERHYYTIAGRTWFQEDLTRFLRSLNSSPLDIEVDVKNISLWSGNIGAYYLKPGEIKRYITLIIRYGSYVLAYEQDDPIQRTGHFRLFHTGTYFRI